MQSLSYSTVCAMFLYQLQCTIMNWQQVGSTSLLGCGGRTASRMKILMNFTITSLEVVWTFLPWNGKFLKHFVALHSIEK